MADLNNLPDLDVSATSFRSTYADLLSEKVDRTPSVPDSAAATRAIAAWANLVDGAVAVIQERLAESSVDGVTRVGDRRIYEVTGSPEGAQTGAVGDVALSDGGALYVKTSGTGNTGWVSVMGVDGSQSLTGDWDAGAHDISLQGTLYVDGVSGQAVTADNIVVGSFSSPGSGITILSDTDTHYMFGRNGAPAVGGIFYAHSIDSIGLRANNGLRLLVSANATIPVNDDWMTLGSASARWADFHAMQGTFYGDIVVEDATYSGTDGNADDVLVTDGAGATSFVDVNTLITPQTSSQTLSGSASSATVDWAGGHYQRVSMDGGASSVAFTLNNPVDGASYQLVLVLGTNSTSRATTWPASVAWAGGTAPPTLDTTGSATWSEQLIRFVYNGTEGRYYGSVEAFSD